MQRLHGNQIRVYRAMNKEEYSILTRRGFEATFKRRWKYFTLTPEYIRIIFDEPDYGLCPKLKYHVAVEFDIVFNKSLEWLISNDIIRVFRERKKYVTVAMKNIVPYYIESIQYREADIGSLPYPDPELVWINKRGELKKTYRVDKAVSVLKQIKNYERILYVSENVIKML